MLDLNRQLIRRKPLGKAREVSLRNGPQYVYRNAMADRDRMRYKRVMYKILTDQVREAAGRASIGNPEPVTDSMVTRWTARMYVAKRPIVFQMVKDGIDLTNRVEVGKGASDILDFAAKQMGAGWGVEDIETLSLGAVGEYDEFLHQARRQNVNGYLERTSKIETATSRRKLDALYGEANSFWDPVKHQGMTPKQMSKHMLNRGLADSAQRAELMSRTMTIWAYNEGAHVSYMEAGVPAESWVATADDATCLIRGTWITLPNGRSRAIEKINVGDIVKTLHGEQRVLDTMCRDYAGKLTIVLYETGRNRGRLEHMRAICTPEHPFYVRRVSTKDEFVEAQDLKSGDVLISDSGGFMIVTEVRSHRLTEPTKVYNLTIEEDQVYFADKALVHNCEFCVQMDGQVVRTGDPFLPAGTEFLGMEGGILNIPTEWNIGHPPLHPMCRCCLVPIVETAQIRVITDAGDRLRSDYMKKVESGEMKELRALRARRLRKARVEKPPVRPVPKTGEARAQQWFEENVDFDAVNKVVQSAGEERDVLQYDTAKNIKKFLNRAQGWEMGKASDARDLVEQIISEWTRDSNSLRSGVLKQMVADRYGGQVIYHKKFLDNVPDLTRTYATSVKKGIKFIKEEFGFTDQEVKQVFRALMDYDRAACRRLLPARMEAYRGTTYKELNSASKEAALRSPPKFVQGNSCSSYTLNPRMPEEFIAGKVDGIILTVEIENEAIALSQYSGFGFGAEGELIIKAGRAVKVLAVQ